MPLGVPEPGGGPTYTAITSRSYHPGGVNVLFGHGSARFVKDSIGGNLWRGLGTTSGCEITSADHFHGPKPDIINVPVIVLVFCPDRGDRPR
jgi:hypothetical protein